MTRTTTVHNDDDDGIDPLVRIRHWKKKKQQQQQQRSESSWSHHQRLNLTAVVLLRLFEEDALHFSKQDVQQWMTYLTYAGVQHFYVYDHCQHAEECLDSYFETSFSSSLFGIITYTRWSYQQYRNHQVQAYNHHLRTHFPQAKYEILLDIDEYPYMPHDYEPGFLVRYLMKQSQQQRPQMLLRTMFYGGKKEPTTATSTTNSSSSSSWRIQNYLKRRRKAEMMGTRTKPIYQPEWVDPRSRYNLHEMRLKGQKYAPGGMMERYEQALPNSGTTTTTTTTTTTLQVEEDAAALLKSASINHDTDYNLEQDPNVIRLNHYWCERLLVVQPKVITTNKANGEQHHHPTRSRTSRFSTR